MKRLNSYVVWIYLLPVFSLLHGQQLQTQPLKYSQIKIQISDQNDINTLLKSGIHLDESKCDRDGLFVTLNSFEIQKLSALGYKYDIQIDDVIENYEKNVRLPDYQLPALQREMKLKYGIDGYEFGSMGGYYTFDEMVTELDSMHTRYPHLITARQSIGSSVQGRDIWMVKISDNPDLKEDEPEIFYNAIHHSNEPQSMATLIYFMYYLLENYGRNPLVTYIIENRELFFVPMINPDGYVYNEQTNPTGGGMWYKNMHDNNGNNITGEIVDGVNINTNYGYQWGYDEIGSSSNYTSALYRGTEPFSEPETQAIRDFCISHDFKLSFNFHSFGNHIFLPWGYELYSHTPDSTTFISLAKKFSLHNNYTYSVSTPVWAVANGILQDWLYGEQNIKNKTFSFTIELGNEKWPSQSHIFPIAQQNVYPNMLMALGEGVLFPDGLLKFEDGLISSKYYAPGQDTIVVSVIIDMPDTVIQDPVIQALIENQDESYLNHIVLSKIISKQLTPVSGSQYTGTMIAPDIEAAFEINLTAELSNYNHFDVRSLDKFTTIGPLVLENYTITSSDTFPNAGDALNVKLTLKNKSANITATEIKAHIISLDSLATVTRDTELYYGDIGPGESAAPTITFPTIGITIAENSPVNVKTFFQVEISSNNHFFWSDTFSIHIDPTGIADNDNNIPLKFGLSQNFPNPFNPSTKIKFQIPSSEFTTLKVFDVLGKEVSTLVSKKLNQGNHTYTFDRKNLASGIYYYQLLAGDYREVKKMILLR